MTWMSQERVDSPQEISFEDRTLGELILHQGMSVRRRDFVQLILSPGLQKPDMVRPSLGGFYNQVRPGVKVFWVFLCLLHCPNSPDLTSMDFYKQVRPAVKIFCIFLCLLCVQTLQASYPWASTTRWHLGLKYFEFFVPAELSKLSRPHVHGIVIPTKPRARGSHLY